MERGWFRIYYRDGEGRGGEREWGGREKRGRDERDERDGRWK